MCLTVTYNAAMSFSVFWGTFLKPWFHVNYVAISDLKLPSPPNSTYYFPEIFYIYRVKHYITNLRVKFTNSYFKFRMTIQKMLMFSKKYQSEDLIPSTNGC